MLMLHAYRHTPSLHDIAFACVQKLGRFKIVKNFDEKTTHVVSSGARTIKALLGITAGSWIVSPAWLMASLEKDEWLDEESYEVDDMFPGAKKSRLLHQVRGGKRLLSGMKIFVSVGTSPAPCDLQNLAVACGGEVRLRIYENVEKSTNLYNR